jgi:hypothetical protein
MERSFARQRRLVRRGAEHSLYNILVSVQEIFLPAIPPNFQFDFTLPRPMRSTYKEYFGQEAEFSCWTKVPLPIPFVCLLTMFICRLKKFR